MKKSPDILINLDRLNQKMDEYGLAGIVARACNFLLRVS